MDIELHYTDTGSGEPIILLHGNNEDSGFFVHQTGFLEELGFRVIAVDTRGHGRSPRGDGEFTIVRFAADLKDFMDELGLRSAIIFGFSDGANIAMEFVIRWPERVRGLVLNGGNMDPWGVKPLVQGATVLAYWWMVATGAARRGAAPGRKRSYEMLKLMVKEPHIAPEELSVVQAPTLVVAGTRDLITERETRRIAAAIDGAELAFVKGSHFVAKESPEEFNRVLGTFLQKYFKNEAE